MYSNGDSTEHKSPKRYGVCAPRECIPTAYDKTSAQVVTERVECASARMYVLSPYLFNFAKKRKREETLSSLFAKLNHGGSCEDFFFSLL